MPIDFYNQTLYTVDLNQLMDTLQSFPIFDNKTLQRNFLNRWKSKIKKAEQNDLKEFKKAPTENAQNLKLNEMFQYEFHIGKLQNKVDIQINFNVEEITKYIKDSAQESFIIPLEYFAKDKRYVTWTPQPTNNISLKKEPIILTHLYNSVAFAYLVIDGNHRLSNAFNKKEKTIEAIILSPNIGISKKFFCSDFDRLMFIFQNEIYYMFHCKKQYYMRDKEILDRSFLKTNEISFLDKFPNLSLNGVFQAPVYQ